MRGGGASFLSGECTQWGGGIGFDWGVQKKNGRKRGAPSTLPPPVFLQKIEMLKRKPKCCLKPSFSRTRHLSAWSTYSRTRHLSGTLTAESDTSLEHL